MPQGLKIPDERNMQEEIHNLKSCIVGIITHVGPWTAIWKVYTDRLQNGTD